MRNPVNHSPECSAPVRAERADKARNRARILTAAAEAFAEGGIDTQMDDVAARAGLGVGTLYRHFATKEALLVGLMERKFEGILEVSRRHVADTTAEPFENFAGSLREGAEVASDDVAAQHVLTRLNNTLWEEVIPTFAELRQQTQILIDRAQAAGVMRPDFDADEVPMLMCGVSATMGIGDWDWRKHLEILLDGLRARPGS